MSALPAEARLGSWTGYRSAYCSSSLTGCEMDDLVVQALKRWPDVPACTGWLALDARGDWWIRDAEVHPWPRLPQGLLDKTGASRVQNSKLIGFIQRNYAADAQGYWFFQNGPQRVYVDLEAAPLVLRLQVKADSPADLMWTTQTGQACKPHAGYVDELGRLFLATSAGPGVLHSLDVALLTPWLDESLQFLRLPGVPTLELETLQSEELQHRLRFQVQPSSLLRFPS